MLLFACLTILVLLNTQPGFSSENQFYPAARNISVMILSDTSARISWIKPEKHSSKELNMYQVVIRALGQLPFHQELRTSPKYPSVVVKDLHRHMKYGVQVITLYQDHHNSVSKEVFFSTQGDPENLCLCDPIGSFNLSLYNCTPNTPHDCACRFEFTGPQCTECVPGMYRPFGEKCAKCPCNKNVSDGLCKWQQSLDTARCTQCLPYRAGRMCELCELGYHLMQGECKPCDCSGSPALCDPESGICTHCNNRTTGNRCQFCRYGLTGHVPQCTGLGPILIGLVGAIIAAALAALITCLVLRGRPDPKAQSMWRVHFSPDDQETSAILQCSRPLSMDGSELQLRGGDDVYQPTTTLA